MYNLQGIIRKSVTNISAEFDRLAYATQNVANLNSNGYKAVRFEDVIEMFQLVIVFAPVSL